MKQTTGEIPKTIMVNLNLAKPMDQEIWAMIYNTQQGKDRHRINYPITESTAVKVLLADRKVARKDMKKLFPPYSNHNSRTDNPPRATKRRGGTFTGVAPLKPDGGR